MKFAILTTAVALVAGAAAAQTTCPTQADLAHGVELIRDEPFVSHLMVQTDRGLTEQRVVTNGATEVEIASLYVHPLLVSERVSEAGTLELQYALDPASLDDLPTIGQWETPVTLLVNGEARAEGVFEVTFLEQGPYPIADCTYTVWRLATYLTLGENPPTFFEQYFAPDLGLILVSLELDATGASIGGVQFDRVIAR